MSKGSKQRPFNREKYNEGWDRIFNEKTNCHFCEKERTENNWCIIHECCIDCCSLAKEKLYDDTV